MTDIQRCIERAMHRRYYQRREIDDLIANNPGPAGDTPYIGGNGNWWIGETDTGIQAQGPQGDPGPPGEDGSSLPRTMVYLYQEPSFTNVNATITAGSWQSYGSSALAVYPNGVDGLIHVLGNLQGSPQGSGNIQMRLNQSGTYSNQSYGSWLVAAGDRYVLPFHFKFPNPFTGAGTVNFTLELYANNSNFVINSSGRGEGVHNLWSFVETYP